MTTKRALVVCSALFVIGLAAAEPPVAAWKHLSSKTGDLPAPNTGLQQTCAVVFDIDGDQLNDFAISERTQAPAVVWFRRTARGWDKYVIDDTHQTPEAGGVAWDVDGDGDLDLILGGDYQTNQVWWYENPRPNFDPKVPWKRHVIKNSGVNMHHDQAIADFKGTGRAQLAFWNQRAQKLFLADIPPHPREAGPWPSVELITTPTRQEGMDVFDIDADGRPDLIAGTFWFKHVGGNEFKATQVCERPGRILAGRFQPGKYPQIVLAPGDGDGPLMFYECRGDPADPKAWVGRDLLGRTLIHGHTLQLADLNGDGHLDILCAEMGKWSDKSTVPDNPNATAWILYGDGAGHFTPTIFSTGVEFHEARVADLDGDGRPDILDKPYSWDTPRVDIWLNQGNAPARR